MRKFSLVLIALILVCSSLFAGVSITTGAGFGYQAILKSDYLKEDFGIVRTPFERGLAAFMGFDLELNNGITVFNDATYGSLTRKPHSQGDYNSRYAIDALYATYLSEDIGAGYTFHVTDKLSLMAGAAFNFKLFFVKANSLTPKTEYKKEVEAAGFNANDVETANKLYLNTCKDALDKTYTLGLSFRLKGTYDLAENWAVSFQMNPTINMGIFAPRDVTVDSEDATLAQYAELFKDASFFSSNALIGVTYKF